MAVVFSAETTWLLLLLLFSLTTTIISSLEDAESDIGGGAVDASLRPGAGRWQSSEVMMKLINL